MTIDVSQIPQDKLNDSRFVDLHSKMEVALHSSKWIGAFCAHEAAHIIYLTRAGATEFTFTPPHISYDASEDEFNGYPASVKANKLDNEILGRISERDWIIAAAKGYAAGGVVSRKLTNAPDHGDTEDYANFCTFCDVLCQERNDVSIDRPEFWKGAQEAVEQDLRSPAARREIWQKADEIKPKFFG